MLTSYYKNKDKTYSVNFTFTYTSNTPIKTKKEALEFANSQLRQAMQEIIYEEKLTFNSIYKYFLANNDSYINSLSKARQSQYKLTIKTAKEFFKGKEFTVNNVNKYLDWLKENRGISTLTSKKYLEVLKVLNKFYFENKKCKNNIFANYKNVEISKAKREKRDVYFTKEEINKIMELADDDLKDYITFSLYTGCRVGEMLNLEYANIIRDNPTPYCKLYQSKVGRQRTGLLTQNLLEMLARREEIYKDKPFPMKKSTLDYRWHKILEKLGLKYKKRYHDLRHTCITWLQLGYFEYTHGLKLNISEISKFIGHSRVSTTENYAHMDYNDVFVQLHEREMNYPWIGE